MHSPAGEGEQRESVSKRMFELVGLTIAVSVGGWALVRLYEVTGSLVLPLAVGTVAGAVGALYSWNRGSAVTPASSSEKTIWLVLFGPLFLMFPAVALYEIDKAGGVEFGAALVTLLFGALIGLTWKVLRP